MKAAAIQINSTRDRGRNLATASRLVREAASAGAGLVVLPEKWPWLARGEGVREGAEPLDGPAVTACREWARELRVHLVAGSFTESHPDGTLTNTCPVISPDGEIVALYRKIHMFDVDVGGTEYRESDHETPGSEIVTFDLDGVVVGLALCYDLRFPELFRALADHDAHLVALPAAFTEATGRHHWEVLLRARAIENQAFLLAAGQFGEAEPGFSFWGHSSIVDPWGRILAGVENGEGYALAGLDLTEQGRIRAEFPALSHRREDLFPNLARSVV